MEETNQKPPDPTIKCQKSKGKLREEDLFSITMEENKAIVRKIFKFPNKTKIWYKPNRQHKNL